MSEVALQCTSKVPCPGAGSTGSSPLLGLWPMLRSYARAGLQTWGLWVGDAERRAAEWAVVDNTKEAYVSLVLAPSRLDVGISAVDSVLIHGVRLMAEKMSWDLAKMLQLAVLTPFVLASLMWDLKHQAAMVRGGTGALHRGMRIGHSAHLAGAVTGALLMCSPMSTTVILFGMGCHELRYHATL
eukprot:jgi/Tetstr1/432960/TSEL_022297.t1